MGTRHLTIVKEGGKVRLAQYGQWDGYPSGQGYRVLDFLRMLKEKGNTEKFKEQLKKIHFMTQRQIDAYWKKAGADKNGMISMDAADAAAKKNPELSRDTGAKILDLVFNNPDKKLGLVNDIDFLNDGMFCEWAWEIDLDQNHLAVYRGGIMPVKTYTLDKLPTKPQLLKLEKHN